VGFDAAPGEIDENSYVGCLLPNALATWFGSRFGPLRERPRGTHSCPDGPGFHLHPAPALAAGRDTGPRELLYLFVAANL